MKTAESPALIAAEMTDTFGGEANYSWVRRITVADGSDLSIVRRVKASLGLAGVRCRRVDYGDQIALYPAGACIVVFIDLNPIDPSEVDS